MTQAAAPGLRGVLWATLPLFASLGLLMAGNSLTSTLLGTRSGLEGFSAAVTGLILAGYYMGFLFGSLAAPKAIQEVGHIRVFAGLASLASCAVILHIVRADPLTWFLLRALAGLCTSGLFVVTEAWLNSAATNASRGGLLASYMVVVTGGMGAGLVLFAATDATGFTGFVLGSVLVSLAVVPVSLARVSAPVVPEPRPMSFRELFRVAPLAPITSGVSGFASAAMIGAGVIYAAAVGLSQIQVSLLLLASLAGGLALQVPLGRWSDRTDRRRVVGLAGLAGATTAAAAAYLGPGAGFLVIVLNLVAGGVAYPLYSLASAHLNDYLDSGLVVAAGARMILINAMGAVAGPIVGALAIQVFGPSGLFGVLGSAYLVVAGFALHRIRARLPVSEQERASYIPVPLGTAPIAATMVQGYEDEVFPVTHGAVERHGIRTPFAEQGAGPALLLVGSQIDGVRWDRMIPALAASGFRTIAVQSSAEDPGEYAKDLFALMRDLELASAALVGAGSGCRWVADFASKHPERVDAVILAGPAGQQSRPEGIEMLPYLAIEDLMAPDTDPVELADAIAYFLKHQPPAAAGDPQE